MNGPFAWGDRNLYVVERGASAPSVAVITGVVAVASSQTLSAPNADTTARLEFVGGEPWFYTPAAGWTKLAGTQVLAEGESAAYQMVFDFAEDRACCSVGDRSVGWVAFGGGDELVGYSERTGASGAVLDGPGVPDEYDPTIPKTQWTSTQKNGVVYLTETGIPDGQTPWKFILSSAGKLSVNTEVDATSSKKINLRTIPSDCPTKIKTAGCYAANKDYGNFMNNGIGGTASQKYSKAAGAIIEEIYLPDSLTKLDQYAFANCTNLVVCDFTKNSQLATIGQQAFYKCNKLRKLRFTGRLTSLTSTTGNAGPIQNCALLRIEGPMLPDNVTTLKGQVFRDCPNAIFGRLTIGGSDTNDIAYLSSYGQWMFGGCTGITEVVFGAGVTKFAQQTGCGFGGCSAITNIVCRNPNGFDFGAKSIHSDTKVNQYDFYGWPTGTLVTKNTGTRILAPRDNATWRALVADGAVFTPWDKLTAAQQATYWTNFPSNNVEKAQIPEGRIAGKSGSKTYAGCTIGYGVWVVFDKGANTVFFVR